MLSEEEKKAIDELKEEINKPVEVPEDRFNTFILYNIESAKIVLNLIKKQSKEIEELKETLKCTQNSWYEDTQKIEEMKKQIDLDNECEIALNSKVMDLEKEIEELKGKNKPQPDCVEPIERAEKMVNMKWVNHNYISKNKIKAKIKEIDIEIQCCEYADDDIEEYKQDIEKEKRRLLRDKAVLQSLLEKE